jgi:hypothetical protein
MAVIIPFPLHHALMRSRSFVRIRGIIIALSDIYNIVKGEVRNSLGFFKEENLFKLMWFGYLGR